MCWDNGRVLLLLMEWTLCVAEEIAEEMAEETWLVVVVVVVVVG